MKVNYIIATWNDLRHDLKENQPYNNNVLKNHLRILATYKNNISQITIMRPRNPAGNNDYYNIEPNGKIKIVDCENEYQSYGQWLKATKLFLEEFDYFIYIEDDYVPFINNFDSILINMYQEGTYLCSLVDKFYWGGRIRDKIHCAISNGLISRQTIKPVLINHDYKEMFDKYRRRWPRIAGHGRNFQRVFSKYFLKNGILLKDYTEFYNVNYYREGKTYTHFPQNITGRKKIFTPIQKKRKYKL